MTSYRIVVPPGWILLPVRDRTDDEIRDLIVDRYRDLPRDSAQPLVKRLADAVVDTARRARDAQVVDILMPLGTAWRVPMSVSIAMAVGDADAAFTGAEIETEAGAAWRDEPPIAPAEATRGARRRLVYQWRIPRTENRALVGTATIVGDDDDELAPIAEGLAELCDAILSTVRWAPEPTPANED